MSLILETWDLTSSFLSLGSRIQNFREYLKDDLRNDEGFYKDVVTTFCLKVLGMRELKRIEEDFPSCCMG
jgi:hypothetical protein